MKTLCASFAISLMMLFVVPHVVLAEAPPSAASIHATKPAVAHDLIRQQQRYNAKHHAQRVVCREQAKAGTHP